MAAISQVKTGWPDAPESPAGSNRYGWPDVIGITGRIAPEYAAAHAPLDVRPNCPENSTIARSLASRSWGFFLPAPQYRYRAKIVAGMG